MRRKIQSAAKVWGVWFERHLELAEECVIDSERERFLWMVLVSGEGDAEVGGVDGC